jgi:hypothetical protein
MGLAWIRLWSLLALMKTVNPRLLRKRHFKDTWKMGGRHERITQSKE